MLHSHTQFCDGRAPMETMARAAFEAGFPVWGFSPHSPICIPSPCNMKQEDVAAFLEEVDRLKTLYKGKMEILAGMEIDYLGEHWGPHIPYFQSLPLDYRIGSVHFVPTQRGEYIDCDGSTERFIRNLAEKFEGDLEYVARKFFSQVREMISLGGFDILGHLDKIATNAVAVDPSIEETEWWTEAVETIIKEAVAAGLKIEINTKAFPDKGRFFPAERWWPLLKHYGAEVLFHSDAHYPEKVSAGLEEAGIRYK